jgi:hypothetical protein
MNDVWKGNQKCIEGFIENPRSPKDQPLFDFFYSIVRVRRNIMVYLALDRHAALIILAAAVRGKDEVWLGSDAITDDEYQQFGSEGVKLSRFIYPLTGQSTEAIQDALSTIEEHHPGEVIWIQHVPRP